MLVAAAEEVHHQIKQLYQGGQGGSYIGQGGPGEGILGTGVFLAMGDVAGIQPGQGPLARIELDGQGDHAEEGGHAESGDGDHQDDGAVEAGDPHDPEHEQVLLQGSGDLHHRHQGRPHPQGGVGFGMLDGMSAFVGSYRG